MPARARNTATDLIRLLALIGICILTVVSPALPMEAAMSLATKLHDQIVALIAGALFQAPFFRLFSLVFGWGIHI